MVVLARDLVAVRRAGQRDLGEPPLLDEVADVAVDGRDAEPRNGDLRGFECLAGRERAVGLLEGAADRVALRGAAGGEGRGHRFDSIEAAPRSR